MNTSLSRSHIRSCSLKVFDLCAGELRGEGPCRNGELFVCGRIESGSSDEGCQNELRKKKRRQGFLYVSAGRCARQ